jgi:hypothetical protein
MSDSIGFNFVPFGDENQTETLFWEYIEQLIAHLDVERVRSSCARERTLLQVVAGALGASGNVPPTGTRVRRVKVFARFAEAFGWRGDEAELLAMWMGQYPNTDDCTTRVEWETRLREAQEGLNSDPYVRHAAFWERCSNHGYNSFMDFWGRRADPFAPVIALIEEAAKALGDE